jgi:hypothetical protein
MPMAKSIFQNLLLNIPPCSRPTTRVKFVVERYKNSSLFFLPTLQWNVVDVPLGERCLDESQQKNARKAGLGANADEEEHWKSRDDEDEKVSSEDSAGGRLKSAPSRGGAQSDVVTVKVVRPNF